MRDSDTLSGTLTSHVWQQGLVFEGDLEQEDLDFGDNRTQRAGAGLSSWTGRWRQCRISFPGSTVIGVTGCRWVVRKQNETVLIYSSVESSEMFMLPRLSLACVHRLASERKMCRHMQTLLVPWIPSLRGRTLTLTLTLSFLCFKTWLNSFCYRTVLPIAFL